MVVGDDAVEVVVVVWGSSPSGWRRCSLIDVVVVAIADVVTAELLVTPLTSSRKSAAQETRSAAQNPNAIPRRMVWKSHLAERGDPSLDTRLLSRA